MGPGKTEAIPNKFLVSHRDAPGPERNTRECDLKWNGF